MLRSRFSASSSTDRRGAGLPRVVGKKFGFDTMRLMGIMVACLMALPVLLTISLIYRNPSPDESSSVFDARFTAQKGTHFAKFTTKFSFGAPVTGFVTFVLAPSILLSSKELQELMWPMFSFLSCVFSFPCLSWVCFISTLIILNLCVINLKIPVSSLLIEKKEEGKKHIKNREKRKDSSEFSVLYIGSLLHEV